ncbi:MAG: phosphopantetheine-binding protein [Flavobacteriales bacterium]
MEEFLKEMIEELTFETVAKDESLIESGILDSITVVDLAVSIENEVGVSIPFNEIKPENFETIEIIMDYVESLKS